MMRPSWHPGRRLVACLAIGVALNVLVAFACLCWSPYTVTPPFMARGTGGDDGVGIPDHTLVRKPPTYDLGFGVRNAAVEHFLVLPRETPGQRHPPLISVQVDSIRVGWPLIAFRSSPLEFIGVDTLDEFRAASVAAIRRPNTYSIGLTARLGAKSHRLLPDGVAPVGFVTNTLLYALVAWIALLGAARMRAGLRRRAGRCTGCNYPLAGLPRCPECGLDASHQAPPASEQVRGGSFLALAGAGGLA